MIKCLVGDKMRVIDLDVFLETHDNLAAHYRAKGLTGYELDSAIVTALPYRLAQVLNGTVYH